MWVGQSSRQVEKLDKVAENNANSFAEQPFALSVERPRGQMDCSASGSARAQSGNATLLREVYPDTSMHPRSSLADAKVESNESRNTGGISIYGSVINLPTSSRKAEAQFRIGLALEKTAKMANPANPNFAQAVAAFRRCTEAYPDSSYAGESFKRIINYHIGMKDYARALETLDHVFRDYADSPWLDEMLVQWGIVLFRQGDRAGAAEKFSRVLEEYPGGSAAPTAKALLGRVSGM